MKIFNLPLSGSPFGKRASFYGRLSATVENMRDKTKLGLRLLLLFVAKHEIEATNWKIIALWAWNREASRARASGFLPCTVSD
ncbi:unnamed protein product [Alternaria burnsii]|nr:unnamed protein product [Alternaria burnsii]